MIQFNLLPDVKLQYIRARRMKHLVILVATVAAGTALAVFVTLFIVVNVWQHQRLNGLTNSIKDNQAKLQAIPDLAKILTVQNQLSSLSDLHNQKPVTSRLFGYVTQLTPAQASIANLHIDFDADTITISGSADKLSTVNKFVDTIKFTKYKVAGQPTQDAFSNVVLTGFSKTGGSTTYQIDFQFNTAIFDSANDITLVVPSIISTRSETEKPTDLFQKNKSSK